MENKKTFGKAVGYIIAEMALIFSSIQLASFLQLPKTAQGFLVVLIIILLALISKYLSDLS